MQYCCVNCFNDKTLKDYITENGKLGNCSFCGAENTYYILPEELEDLFIPIVGLYNIIENFMPLEDLKNWDGDFIWQKLNEDWEIFAFYDYAKQEELVKAIFSNRDPKDGDDQFLHSFVEMESEYWGDEDEASDKLEKEWDLFCEEIRFKHRYFPTKGLDLELLSELLPLQTHLIETNSSLYRSRKCHTKDKIHPSEMGKPPVEKSQHGRANPKGIPYLYVSSDLKTAIAEIRPFLGDKVTVGHFLVKARLEVVDLRDPKIDDPFRFGESLGFAVRYLNFLRRLGFELSKTVSPIEAELEYIPLQYLCEFIRKSGFDGVIYESSVAEGYNIAIFTDHKVECRNAELYEIKDIQYTSEKIS